MNVDLPQEMWQVILQLLAKHPYEQSAQLIHGISRQLQDQARPNGEAVDSVGLRPGA